ncbi:hypothetical protein RAS1_38030 [Phycisphaerae bacterium RAS1]|nr:hypothetical protein RAS1_38030 [Phycisphaerae bacterium RAS1]
MWWVVPTTVFTAAAVLGIFSGELSRYLSESGVLSPTAAVLVSRGMFLSYIVTAMLLSSAAWRQAGWTMTAGIAAGCALLYLVELTTGGSRPCGCLLVDLVVARGMEHIAGLVMALVLVYLSFAAPQAAAPRGRFRWSALWLLFGSRAS